MTQVRLSCSHLVESGVCFYIRHSPFTHICYSPSPPNSEMTEIHFGNQVYAVQILVGCCIILGRAQVSAWLKAIHVTCRWQHMLTCSYLSHCISYYHYIGMSFTLKPWATYLACRRIPVMYEWSSLHGAHLKVLWLAAAVLSHSHPTDTHSIDLSRSKVPCMLWTHSTWVIFAPCTSSHGYAIALK